MDLEVLKLYASFMRPLSFAGAAANFVLITQFLMEKEASKASLRYAAMALPALLLAALLFEVESGMPKPSRHVVLIGAAACVIGWCLTNMAIFWMIETYDPGGGIYYLGAVIVCVSIWSIVARLR